MHRLEPQGAARAASRRRRGRQSRRRAVALVVSLVVAGAGCGSTVSPHSAAGAMVSEAASMSGAPGGATADDATGLTLPPSDGPTSAVAPGNEVAAAGTAGPAAQPAGPSGPRPGRPRRGAGVRGSGGGADGDGGGDGAVAAPIPAAHPGAGSDFVNLGFIYTSGAERYQDAIGGGGGAAGNTRRQIEAVVETVNDAGGIAGRQIRLFPFEFDFAGQIDSQLQAACAYFTQDNRMFAVSGNIAGVTGGIGDVLYSCLGKSDVAYVENSIAGDDEMFARYPNIAFAPGTFNANRVHTLNIDALAAAGWFGAAPTIGIHSIDSPLWRRVVAGVVKPRLAAYGFAVEEEFYYRLGATGADGAPEYSGATLRFKNSGVTHVLNVGNHPFLFANAAEAQGWRPRWSVDSDTSPANWAAQVPSAQLAGSLGIGWAPSRDVQPSERGRPVNRADRRCAAIMRAAGEDPNPAVARQTQSTACAFVFFIRDALAQAPEISTAGLAQGWQAQGAGHLDPTTWHSRSAATRRDGAAAYRMLGFVDACSCYRYVSGLQQIPRGW